MENEDILHVLLNKPFSTFSYREKKNVPRVALLGSGGGQRAHISFLGVIRQLKKEELLDCFHYVAGVSGSTWSMSSLYQNPTWSRDAEKATSDALLSMSTRTESDFFKAVQWLKEREEHGNLSLSDVWGVITCRIKGVSLETRLLTADIDTDGNNPYPLYSAVGIKQLKDKWFEFSPHESGFLQHGAYVDTSLLNKKFDGGHVKPPPKKPVDMVQLQGMCGCAMGDIAKILERIKDVFSEWISGLSWLFHRGGGPGITKKMPGFYGVDVVIILAELLKSNTYSFDKLEKLKDSLGDQYQEFSASLERVDGESWRNMTDQGKKTFVENLCDELAASADRWGNGHLVVPESTSKFQDVWWVFKHIIRKIAGWEFGTMPNILYNFQDPDPAIPEDMIQDKEMHLVDAGLYLNSPYPSVLGKARGIDLIISFDFSDVDPFETLKVATKYAAATGHPFPKVDFTKLDPKRPRSYYVFEEKGKPTVIHIPLFNMDNCKNQETIEMEKRKYTTFQLPYKDEAKIDHLAHLAGLNVSMNKDHILKEIKKAAQRRSRH